MKKLTRKKRVLISTVLFFASAGCVCTEIPASAYAAQAMPLTECTVLPEWRVSFSAADHPAKLRSRHAGNKITGRGKIIYDFLASEIKKIAEGEKSSTQFAIPIKDLVQQLQYTPQELGVPFNSKEEQHYALGQFMERELITDTQLRVIYDSLLANLPYELYWYDKSAEDSFIVSLDGAQTRNDSGRGLCLCVDNAVLTFHFSVDRYYGSDYQTNAASIHTAMHAAANAQKIVEEAAQLSDYQKLAYYCEKICALTSYNLQAAQTRSPGNKNPWQLVYVFDEDSSTNTVCEGYAKAFQYLCDLTAFEDEDIYSYIVTGTVSELTGQGLHMWNIVHMGANGNYLVDVTNCDQGMIGENNQLFLAGYTQGNITNGYRFEVSSRQISYQYLEEMKYIYSHEDLTLVQGPALKESAMHVHSWQETQKTDSTCTSAGQQTITCSVCGKSKTQELPAIGHAYEMSYFLADDKDSCTIALACKNDSTHRLVQHAGNPALEHQDSILDVKNPDGSDKYTLHLDAKDLTVGNNLSVYRLDKATGKYQLTDGPTAYTVKEDGSITVSLPENETYQFLNTEEAAAVNKSILKTVAPQKQAAALKKGSSIRFALHSGLDTENIKSITYASSKKTVAAASTNGKITAKKAGTAVIKAKVTLKNGMMKVIAMKIRVK